jgi:hypothetical protein
MSPLIQGSAKANVDFDPMVIGADTRIPAQKSGLRETPQAKKRRGGSRTARGKRAPGVEINRQN